MARLEIAPIVVLVIGLVFILFGRWGRGRKK